MPEYRSKWILHLKPLICIKRELELNIHSLQLPNVLLFYFNWEFQQKSASVVFLCTS